MKRRVWIILLSVVLLCATVPVGYGISQQLAHQRAQALAQTVADALGRTPANGIVEFEACGMLFSCGYNVYFASRDDLAGMTPRVLALGKLNLNVALASPFGSGSPLLNILNGDLNRTRIHGRLTVTAPSTYREPANSIWYLQNEQGQIACIIWLYRSKDTGVTYLFDGKPIPNANIVHVYTEVNPTKY